LKIGKKIVFLVAASLNPQIAINTEHEAGFML